MDFAKKQLLRYGWKEGQGLGKQESGIAKPIKVAIKRDNIGVGASPGEEFTSDWWSKLFNNAASNISVATGEDSVRLESTAMDSGTSLKSRHYGRHRSGLLYGGFVNPVSVSTDHRMLVKVKESTKLVELNEQNESPRKKSVSIVSDDALVKACEGRTGHKAARHGFKLNGKLKRLGEQEKKHSNYTATRKRTKL